MAGLLERDVSTPVYEQHTQKERWSLVKVCERIPAWLLEYIINPFGPGECHIGKDARSMLQWMARQRIAHELIL